MAQPAVLVVDTDGVIQAWSPGVAALFGHTAADARGQTLDLIVPPEFRERHWAGFRRAIASGSSVIEGLAAVLPVLCADGLVRRFAGKLSLLRDPANEVVGAMAIYGETGEATSHLPILGG